MNLTLNHRQAASLHRLLTMYFNRPGASKGNVKFYQDGSTIKWEDGRPDMVIEVQIPNLKSD